MSGPQMPPHVVAALDQCRAELVELVQAVREHADADMCEVPGYCPGIEVARFLARAGGNRRHALLLAALAELAALDYGAPVHLTDAAHAVLDEPKSRRWWSWLRR